MTDELLSICIPTRNRAKYLKSLLFKLELELNRCGNLKNNIKIYISDNYSSDNTSTIISEFILKFPSTEYYKNNPNGANDNITKVRTYAKGKYVWCLGDDELILNGSILKLISFLDTSNCGLVILYPLEHTSLLPRQNKFATYTMFANACINQDSYALSEHTLISSNIYRRDCYNFNFAYYTIDTPWPHMYAMVDSLIFLNLSTEILPFPVINLRNIRASPVDGTWIKDFDVQSIAYFSWLKNRTGISSFDPTEPIAKARKNLINRIKKNPFKFIINNYKSLFNMKAYIFVMNRIINK